MALLERKRKSKWHKQITATVREINPSEEALSDKIALFPYAQVHALTKEYLDKRKRSQIEKDKALVDLIHAHPRKEVAFASCAEALSDSLVLELLSDLFIIDTLSLHGLENYLEAFLAAAHSKPELFDKSDTQLATSIISPTLDVLKHSVTSVTARDLFLAWQNGPPRDLLLLARVKLLSRKVFQQVGSALADRTSPKWWADSKRWLLAFSASQEPCSDLADILSVAFPSWRSWASWRPDSLRLEVWASSESAGPFWDLRDLDGPAVSDHAHSAEWQALIRRQELLAWLQSRYTLGVSLITDDREEHLTCFIQHLLDIVAAALKRGSAYVGLLKRLIDDQGLDWQPLKVWHGVISMMHADMIELIVRSKVREDSDVVLVRGLDALCLETAKDIKAPLAHSIGTCINQAADKSQAQFLRLFASSQLWLTNAERLWVLRQAMLKADWLHDYINERLLIAAKSQISTITALSRLAELQKAAKSIPGLEASVDVYVQRFVLDGCVARCETTTMPQVLHTLFCCTEREDIRKTGMALAAMTGFDVGNRTLCIRQLLSLPTDLVQKVYGCLPLLPRRQHRNIVSLTGVVRYMCLVSDVDATCFGSLLSWSLKDSGFHVNDAGFTSLGFKAYAAWISDLNEATSLDGLYRTHVRLSSFIEFAPVIENLELCTAKRIDVSSLITNSDEHALEACRHTFQCLMRQESSSRRDFLYAIILAADLAPHKLEALCGTIYGVSALGEKDLSTCEEFFNLCRSNEHVASTRLKIWRHMWLFDANTEQMFVDLAHTLGMDVSREMRTSSSYAVNAVRDTRDYYADRVAKLVEATQRLEAAKKLLNKIDPDAVASLVDELDLEELKPAAAMVAELPYRLLDHIDETADDIVELHFPLSSPTLSTMERLSFGLKCSETLLVQLRIDKVDEVQAFCVHVVDQESHSSDYEHNFTIVSSTSGPPDRSVCHGRQSRLSYLVSRLLWRQLTAGCDSLGELYEIVRQFLHSGASLCMVCASPFNVSLHRSAICSSADCNITYRLSQLDVRLEELRSDGKVIDLLLSSVYAASSVGTLELLPSKPAALGTPPEVVKLLNSMPATATLAMDDFDQSSLDEDTETFFSWLSDSFPGFMRRPTSVASTAIQKNPPRRRTELLLSWLCCSPRGFIVSATDRYRIPIFANVQQFLLVDAPPEVEAAFARHNHIQPRNILFHGTSMDRLYSVLCQGLRVLSGTALQRHGAAFGPGIYFAREPSLAMSFSSRTAGDTKDSFFDSRSDFKNVTVLLGCEHAGNDENASPRAGVHVVTDPSRVMVRYIWIVPHGTKVPRAQDLQIPMMSTFNDLRMTAVSRPR